MDSGAFTGGCMRHLTSLAFVVICSIGHLGAESPVRRLQDVRTIYVAPFGGENTALANLISAKLVSYLAKHHDISVVESAENADAILTGTGLIQNTTNVYGRVSPHVQAAMRLDSKDGVVMW